ncbi:MAG: CYTH domain-containing protein, partial [Patescibacteria group bacterium]
FIFTVKQPHPKVALTKTEYETEVKDAGALERALFLMGYQIANKVTKLRRTTYFGRFEICIDEVEKIGAFIEIEKMSDEDPILVRKELQKFLLSLGVSTDDEVHKGYDIMALERQLLN